RHTSSKRDWSSDVCSSDLSGFGLGSDALQAAFAAHDQAGPATILEESIQHFFKKQSLPDIIPEIYQATSPKETIASLGRLVMEEIGRASCRERVATAVGSD